MTIVLTGGGSGGHITPLLAVAHELKQLEPDTRVVYIGYYGDSLGDIASTNPDIDEAYSIHAGKFRRYGGAGLKQMLYFKTLAKNARDGTRVLRGLAESRSLLKRLKPDLVFIKGGFVGVPVGLAAAKMHIPIVTHDSDAIPGLANRVIAKWATAHAVALPKKLYPYPAAITHSVGVPISSDFQPVNYSLVNQYKWELGLAGYDQIIVVTGGGNGARQLNSPVAASSAKLLKHFPHLAIVHIAGRSLVAETEALYAKLLTGGEASRVLVKGFVTDFYRYSGAASLIIARGSATNLAEFAMQSKPCIIVPAPQLVWTVRNAEALVESQAAKVIFEEELSDDPDLLTKNCIDLLESPAKQKQLSANLTAALAHPHAARELAELLLKTAAKS